jgi:hypothetical protein
VCDEAVPPIPGDTLAAIAQQTFVDRAPPWAARRRRIHRRQHAAAQLPAHERQSRPAKRQVPRCAADRTVIGPGDQLETGCWIVTDGFDLTECPHRGGRSRTHAPIVGQRLGPCWAIREASTGNTRQQSGGLSDFGPSSCLCGGPINLRVTGCGGRRATPRPACVP